MGKIVCLGEVMADIYRGEGLAGAGMPLNARPGGAPANLAVAAVRLGAEASFVGSVGEDLFGNFVLRALRAGGVDTSGVVRRAPPALTSLAFVEIGEGGDRSFTFYRSDPASEELLSPDDVPEELLSGASFVSFGSIPLIKDPSRAAVRRAARLARDLGARVAFDVNFREHLFGTGAETARGAVEEMFEGSYVVKLSSEELPLLFGTEEPRDAAEELLARGVRLIFVTSSAGGASYFTEGFEGSVPAYPVEAVDATGAGDAFFAAALVRLSEGLEEGSREGPLGEGLVREAARWGAAAGAVACTDYGATRALPDRERLQKILDG